ncbi:hypothetical protein RCG17_19950 [Neobacillus sp. PS3-12]|jgi:hypothetical protein|uniref:hypothetical protein n=1 Tax=Neobacillus sp. PS3-12 TaxID=3070677 RepID=UPI0027E1B2F6|nr:hypothetical protein [Neobacillus sp. PS3-12]WML51688.1 hypothetical protein RCG17_19950 [Neobacillus sp. PS3-12]
MLEGLISYGILALIIGGALFCFYKAGKKQKNKKQFFFSNSLGINLLVLPLSFFIGGMATDSGDESLFWSGFLFVQAIPLLILLVSIVILLVGRFKKQ